MKYLLTTVSKRAVTENILDFTVLKIYPLVLKLSNVLIKLD